MIKRTVVGVLSAVASFALSMGVIAAPLILLEMITCVFFESFTYHNLGIGMLEFIALRILLYIVISIVIYLVSHIIINSIKLYKPINKLIIATLGYSKAKRVHDKLSK